MAKYIKRFHKIMNKRVKIVATLGPGWCGAKKIR